MASQFEATASEEAQKINDQVGPGEYGMTLVTDQEFWEKQGISTGEELAISVLGQTYSDLHKDARGFRPRQWKKNVDWLNQAIADLDKEMESALRDDELEAQEAAQLEKDRADIETLMPQPDDYEDLPTHSGMGRRQEGKIRVTRSELESIILEELNCPLNEGAIDWMQGGLDIIGLVPGVGEAADGLNAAISLARGNPIEALLSGISMIPGAGDVVGKGGKLLLKALDPVMPMIKSGDDIAKITAKIGPDKMKKLEPIMLQFKDIAVQHGPKIQEIFSSVKSADLDAVESAGGFKVPDIAREKAEELLKKAADEIKPEDMEALFTFLSDFELPAEGEEGVAPPGEESVEDKAASDKDMSSAVNKLAAGLMHPRGSYLLENNTIVGYVLGDDYINNQLREMAVFFRRLSEGGFTVGAPVTDIDDFQKLQPGDRLTLNGKPIVVISADSLTASVDYVEEGKATRKHFDYRYAAIYPDDEPDLMPELAVIYLGPGPAPKNVRLPRRSKSYSMYD